MNERGRVEAVSQIMTDAVASRFITGRGEPGVRRVGTRVRLSARVDGETKWRVLLCRKRKYGSSINSQLRYILGYPQCAPKHTL